MDLDTGCLRPRRALRYSESIPVRTFVPELALVAKGLEAIPCRPMRMEMSKGESRQIQAVQAEAGQAAQSDQVGHAGRSRPYRYIRLVIPLQSRIPMPPVSVMVKKSHMTMLADWQDGQVEHVNSAC